MNTCVKSITAALLLAVAPAIATAQETGNSQSTGFTAGTTDAETGAGTRTWLKEQAEGVNRGDVEAYRAESAGKAYRAYVDSIGAKDQAAPVSQVSTIQSN
jgi:hypothetical protein